MASGESKGCDGEVWTLTAPEFGGLIQSQMDLTLTLTLTLT